MTNKQTNNSNLMTKLTLQKVSTSFTRCCKAVFEFRQPNTVNTWSDTAGKCAELSLLSVQGCLNASLLSVIHGS